MGDKLINVFPTGFPFSVRRATCELTFRRFFFAKASVKKSLSRKSVKNSVCLILLQHIFQEDVTMASYQIANLLDKVSVE